ncbi:hypothetical protein, partial [Sporisorium scitamineum]
MSTTAARRGSFPRLKGRSQQVQDDTEEVRTLRAKYSEQLDMIRELFPTWTDEDLLFALQESLGDVENAVVRISEGQVEQFSSVKPKKQVKKESGLYHAASTPYASSAAPSAAPHAARANHHVGAPASRGRGGASVRGARGGRGGFRGVGGRGGGIAPQANGHDLKTPETQTVEATTAQAFAPIATPTSGTSWAAALARSNNKATPAAAATPAPAPAITQEITEPASATTTAALSSSTENSAPAVKVPAPAKATPTSGGMSWAQIARKSEAPKPAAAPVAAAAPSESTPVTPVSDAAPVEAVAAPSTAEVQPELTEPAAVAAAEPSVEAAAAPVAAAEARTSDSA